MKLTNQILDRFDRGKPQRNGNRYNSVSRREFLKKLGVGASVVAGISAAIYGVDHVPKEPELIDLSIEGRTAKFYPSGISGYDESYFVQVYNKGGFIQLDYQDADKSGKLTDHLQDRVGFYSGESSILNPIEVFSQQGIFSLPTGFSGMKTD